MDSNARLKLLWRRWYVKAAVATVIVLALLVVVWFGALRPTYTADEVTKKMQAYLRGKVSSQEQRSELDSRLSGIFGGPPTIRTITTTTYCSQVVGKLSTPKYIPYRRAWIITSRTRLTNFSYTWLFDERTGTIASSSPGC